MKRLGLILILSLLAARVWAQTPEISQMMDPSRPGQTLLLSGEGFDQNTKFKLWLPMPGTAPGKEEEIYGAFGDPPGLPLTPPKEAVDLTPLVVQPQYAGLELPQTVAGFPEGRFYGPYYAVIWAGNAQGWGKPYVLNRPRVFFSWPHAAAPGEQVRLFGRNFSWWQYELDAWPGLGHAVLNRVVALRKVGGGPLIKPVQQEIYYGHRDYMVNYHTQIILPADLPEGDYEVRVHSGSGGKWGWSEPLILPVRKPEAWPQQVFHASESGAIADGQTDQSETIGKALAAAGANGGGVVLLDPGIYCVKGALNVPTKVVLRGAGKNATIVRSDPQPSTGAAMINLAGPCTLEDLAVELPGQVSRGGGVRLSGTGLKIQRCRFETQHYFTWGQGVMPNTVLGPLVDGEITYCDFDDLNHCYISPATRSRMAFCTAKCWDFLTGGSYLGIGGKEDLMEHNTIDAPRGTGAGRLHDFYVGNLVQRTLVCDGEPYLTEECGMQWYAKAGQAQYGLNTVTLPGAKFKPSTETEPGLSDKMVVITEGRGVGQYRLIASNTADTITLAEPFRVTPNETSACIVMTGSCEATFVNNQAYDCNGPPPGFFYAGAMDCIVDGTITRNTGAPYFWSDFRNMATPTGRGPLAGGNSSAWDFYLKPDYWNQYLHLQLQDTTGILLNATRYGADSQPSIPGMVQMGTRISDSLISGSNAVLLKAGNGAARTNCVNVNGPVHLVALENSTLSDCDTGITVSAEASDVIVRRNLLMRLKQIADDPAGHAQVAPLADKMYYVDIGIGWNYPRPDGKNVGFLLGGK